MSPAAFVALQQVLPQHLLSRVVLRATRITYPPWKNLLIGRFIKSFNPDLSEAEEPDPFAYANFNEFFTRALRSSARPMADAPAAIVSPVDGTVSQAGRIAGQRILQAKGHDYSLDALLAGEPELVNAFRDGEFATLYLAPHNYHRVHMPVAGRLAATVHVPGRLFSVNTSTAARVPGLFARNERVICLFDTDLGRVALILVGALFVGSIATVWAGEITATRRRHPTRLAPPPGVINLARGAEMGRFNMGSTVMLLFEPGRMRWNSALAPGATVRVGAQIGEILAPPQPIAAAR